MLFVLFHLLSTFVLSNIEIHQPSVVTFYNYDDPLYIDSHHYRESRHAQLLSLNMKPGNYSIHYSNSPSQDIQYDIDPGFGFFSNHLEQSVLINDTQSKSLVSLGVYLKNSGLYSISLAYRLLGFEYQIEQNVIVEFKINDNTIYTNHYHIGSLYRNFIFLEEGFHVLTLTGKLIQSSCSYLDEYDNCLPVVYCLCPSAGNGYLSFARLGIWGHSEDHSKQLAQYGIIENIQNHFNYLLPKGPTRDLQIYLL